MGSSPLARGLPGSTGSFLSSYRIIPARAGFTKHSHQRPEHSRDHPRSRGVYRFHTTEMLSPYGSSPLARGLLLPLQITDHLLRIIPARAGFTHSQAGTRGYYADHPRSRGVYPLWKITLARRTGSSPLARGLPCVPIWANYTRRIIPARAGFTSRAARSRWKWLDHPRSRGVYCTLNPTARDTAGSSPLARGLRTRGYHA